MPGLTTYSLEDGVATITMDDGKVNALSTAMLGELSEALDRAQADEAVVVLTGRATTFSAGFDLRCAPEGWPEMLVAGASLAAKLMAFPRPVLAACNGNAIAMGGFVLLSCDHRIGSAGDFKIGLNEAAIGMTVPYFGLAIARHRLARHYYDRCTITGVLLDPAEAQTAGFLDAVVPADQLQPAAREAAAALTGLDMNAHAATKLRVREAARAGIQDGIDRITGSDRAAW